MLWRHSARGRSRRIWSSWRLLVAEAKGGEGLGKTAAHGTPLGCCVLFVGDPEASFTLSWSCLGTDAHLKAPCKEELQQLHTSHRLLIFTE